MADQPRTHLLAYALALVAIVAFGARQLAHGGAGPAAPPAPLRLTHGEDEAPSGGRVVVDVAGAVRRPGVYRMPAGSRVDDAIRRAGGPTRRGDLTTINLAAKLEDGRQILVPRRAPALAPAAVGAAAGAGAPAGPVNLNTATAEQLDTLDGVGPATAQKILDYRAAHGGFSSVDELDQIPGIGEARMAALRPQVTV